MTQTNGRRKKMENQLTDRDLWKSYWENYHFTPIEENPVYKKYIRPASPQARFIEIGGFPGLNAGYFYRHVCRDVTLLDFYVEPEVIRKVESQNQIPAHTIKSIEADFFSFQSRERYDIVFSLGFIEHFRDTRDVIARHAALLAEGGQLLILLPNLRGINGAVQYLFDRENLRIHNLDSMVPSHLRHICEELGLENIRVEYTRKPMVWLEPKAGKKQHAARLLVKALSYGLKLFPIKCRLLSPYLVISATKGMPQPATKS